MKIGNIEIKGKVVQGPMAGVSNEAFRLLAKEYGASLVCAEMVSIEGLLHENKKTFKMLKVNKNEHPMSLQMFGNNIETFKTVTKLIDQNVDCEIIDLNIGCPAPKIAIKSESGSALLKTPEMIYEIVKSVVENTSKPVTAKIRLGWDRDSVNVVEVAKLIEKAGASAITVHGRTRNDFYTGHADWEKIKEVKDAVKIPVIGNGDVVDGPSAKLMLETTGCDAVMVSRACQGNPWIFKQINYFLETGQELPKPSFDEWYDTVIRHAKMLIINKEDESSAIREFRKHLTWYWDVLPKTSNLKKIKEKSNQIETLNDIENLIREYKGN